VSGVAALRLGLFRNENGSRCFDFTTHLSVLNSAAVDQCRRNAAQTTHEAFDISVGARESLFDEEDLVGKNG
jgi:hypothetical protein